MLRNEGDVFCNTNSVSGAGYGIHWPDLDEDIGVEGILLGKKSSESQASFERWLQRRQTAQQSSQS